MHQIPRSAASSDCWIQIGFRPPAFAAWPSARLTPPLGQLPLARAHTRMRVRRGATLVTFGGEIDELDNPRFVRVVSESMEAKAIAVTPPRLRGLTSQNWSPSP